MRDYERWHEAYEDPGSSLSWRLRIVQEHIIAALDRYPGPVRVLSSCAGDGRDILGVLAQRRDADRVSVTLLELHPRIAQRAREAAAAVSARVEVRTVDAGTTDAYVGAVPADLVLMVGIFGNISDEDLQRTIAATPELCRPGSTLLWSRGCDHGDRNDLVRAGFLAAGFAELDYSRLDNDGDITAIGAMRYDGGDKALLAGQRLFTFLR